MVRLIVARSFRRRNNGPYAFNEHSLAGHALWLVPVTKELQTTSKQRDDRARNKRNRYIKCHRRRGEMKNQEKNLKNKNRNHVDAAEGKTGRTCHRSVSHARRPVCARRPGALIASTPADTKGVVVSQVYNSGASPRSLSVARALAIVVAPLVAGAPRRDLIAPPRLLYAPRCPPILNGGTDFVGCLSVHFMCLRVPGDGGVRDAHLNALAPLLCLADEIKQSNCPSRVHRVRAHLFSLLFASHRIPRRRTAPRKQNAFVCRRVNVTQRADERHAMSGTTKSPRDKQVFLVRLIAPTSFRAASIEWREEN